MLAFPPDITFFIQLVSFFVLLAILNKLLFVPYGDVLEQRTARTEGASRDAADHRSEADELAARINEELKSARLLAGEEADRIRQRTRSEESEILEKAKWDATAQLTELRASIAAERDGARQSLESDARALAEEMVGVILGSRGNR
jgi:F-type H+-transporting ATPase subunit b